MLRSWSPNQLIMNPLNSLTYFSAVFTVLTVLCFGPAASEDCGQEELAACSRPLQVLSDTSELSFVTKKSELDKLCPDLHAGLSCIRSYTRRCMSMDQRTHFHKLYQGTTEVIQEMCQTGPYQEDFLRHAPCMKHVKAEYDVCTKRYQTTMTQISAPSDFELQQQLHLRRQQQREMRERHNHHNHHHQQQQQQHEQQPEQHQHHQHQQHQMMPLNGTEYAAGGAGLTSAELEDERNGKENIKLVCCSFREYIACTEHTVRRSCGEEAAYFTRSFMDKISNSMMRLHCENFTAVPGQCGTPLSGAGRLASTSAVTVLLSAVAAFVAGFH